MVHSAQGEDRSSFQSVGSWTTNTFGFVKATEATDWEDPTFAANWAALKAEGRPRGAYHFFHPELDAAAQATFFLSVVKAHGLDLLDMLVIDSEVFPGPGGALVVSADGNGMAKNSVPFGATLSSADVVGSGTLAFLEALQEGIHPHNPRIVYTTLSGIGFLGDCHKYQLWIAHPSDTAPTPAQVSPWENWRFWQWEFGGGPGGGDRDAFNGTEAEMQTWLDTYLPHPPSIRPAGQGDGS
jgi:lysozyme